MLYMQKVANRVKKNIHRIRLAKLSPLFKYINISFAGGVLLRLALKKGKNPFTKTAASCIEETEPIQNRVPAE